MDTRVLTADPGLQARRPWLATLGAALFALWGALHLWVGYEGTRRYLASPADGQWKMFIGGSRAPLDAFAFPTDPVTVTVQAHLIQNFCLDVAGYGVLGLVVAWLVYRHASWVAYGLGVALIGICDMSFLFLQLTSGIIAVNVPSLSGPLVWFLAVLITPFGLPPFRNTGRSAWA